MTSIMEAARQAMHAELQKLARRPGGGPFELRVRVDDTDTREGRQIETTTERGPNIKRKGAPK